MQSVAKRLGVFDPSGRLLDDLAAAADRARAELEPYDLENPADGLAGLLVAPAVASDLGPMPEGGPARWVVGDPSNAARIAGAAASAHAAGVLLAPVTAEALDAIAQAEPTASELEIARARG